MTKEKRNTAIYTAFEDVDASELPTPERSLLRAILLNAIADINRNDEHSRKARDYFLSKEDDYIFSFQAVCSYLNIDPRNILILVGLQENPRLKGSSSTALIEEETTPGVTGEAAGDPPNVN